MTNPYKDYNTHLLNNLKKGTLFRFSQHAHYSPNKDTRQYALISSELTPISNNSHISISNSYNYNYTRSCQIIWNNEEHEAIIFTFKNDNNRPYIKLFDGYINGHKSWGNSLPITQIIA